jgi:hypothetical protein
MLLVATCDRAMARPKRDKLTDSTKLLDFVVSIGKKTAESRKMSGR